MISMMISNYKITSSLPFWLKVLFFTNWLTNIYDYMISYPYLNIFMYIYPQTYFQTDIFQYYLYLRNIRYEFFLQIASSFLQILLLIKFTLPWKLHTKIHTHTQTHTQTHIHTNTYTQTAHSWCMYKIGAIR